MGEVQSWVGGYAVKISEPYAELYYGQGCAIYMPANTTNWFSFPLCNRGGGILGLERVYILYKTIPYARINRITVWDGAHVVEEMTTTADAWTMGDHLAVVEQFNSYGLNRDIRPHKTWYGLQIMVEVGFGEKTPDNPMNYAGIQFAAVGAGFTDYKD